MKNIRLIALDLDGTTLNNDRVISSANRQALEAAADKGVNVVIATGRAFCALPKDVFEVRGIRYVLTSNRESGFGRYDVQLEPRKEADDAILLEFKVRDSKKEKSMEETAQNALAQIESRDYASGLRERGIPEERIRKYGFAFEGKMVLIGEA